MGKAQLIVEGHGETEAARNLVTRLWPDLELPYTIWATPKRGKALHTKPGVLTACELLRSERDCSFALLLRDEDDGCPATAGPETAGWVESAALPFPVAVVLAHREYEAWFLPCVHLMAGRDIRPDVPGVRIVPGTKFEGDPESIRGVKEWLSAHYPRGKAYKPTLDQSPLTRMLDFPTLRASGARSFGTLERALRFLAMPGNQRVYPSPQ
jgi:hypothetical protein